MAMFMYIPIQRVKFYRMNFFFFYKAPFSKESYLTLRSNVQNKRGGGLGFLLDCNTNLKIDCNI